MFTRSALALHFRPFVKMIKGAPKPMLASSVAKYSNVDNATISESIKLRKQVTNLSKKIMHQLQNELSEADAAIKQTRKDFLKARRHCDNVIAIISEDNDIECLPKEYEDILIQACLGKANILSKTNARGRQDAKALYLLVLDLDPEQAEARSGLDYLKAPEASGYKEGWDTNNDSSNVAGPF